MKIPMGSEPAYLSRSERATFKTPVIARLDTVNG